MLNAVVHYAMPDVMWNYIWLKPKATPKFPTIPSLYFLTTFKCGTQAFTACISDKEWNEWLKENKDLADKFLTEEKNAKWTTMMGRLGDAVDLIDFWLKCGSEIDFSEAETRAKKSSTIMGKVKYGEEIFEDPQVQFMKTIASVQSSAGTYRAAKPPARFSATPSTLRTGAPALGEHTAKACTDWGIAVSMPNPAI